jgi:hypothetical protein
MDDVAENLAFQARALAQSHPLTPIAHRFVQSMVANQRSLQSHIDAADWAGVELVSGYCLRRVEENAEGLQYKAIDSTMAIDSLDRLTDEIATALRVGDPEPYLLGEPARTFVAMNHLISSEIDHRLFNLRDEMDAEDCWQFENYATAWVVKGYALRVAEFLSGALE